MTPRLRDELIKLGILTDATDKSFMANSAVAKDLIWTETTRHIIRTRKPNLLVLHLLNCDSTQHAEGQSPAGYTANAYADMCLARVLDPSTKPASVTRPPSSSSPITASRSSPNPSAPTSSCGKTN